MRISVIVPVYNEEKTVAQVLEMLSHVSLDLDVIIVDDASTDRTWKILQELRQHVPFDAYRYVRHEHNQGKGAALRTGFGLVSGDLVLVQDADLEYDAQDLLALVHKWEEATQAGYDKVAVYGVRNLSRQKFTTRWGNHFLTAITNVLYDCRIHDMTTCYKLIPSHAVCTLPMKMCRFEIDPEITACILQTGYRIFEVPISCQPRPEKKLQPWKDGWPTFGYAFALSFQNAIPFCLKLRGLFTAEALFFTCPFLPHKLSLFALKLSALSLGKTSLVGYL